MTADELKKEAAKIKKVARIKEQELLKKAKEIELKNFAKLGELTIEFLNKKIDKDALKSFAITNKIIEEEKQNEPTN